MACDEAKIHEDIPGKSPLIDISVPRVSPAIGGAAYEERIISSRTFLLGGIEVEELLFLWEPDMARNWVKLAWVRPLYQNRLVDGMKNPFVHYDLPADYTPSQLARAMSKIKVEFILYWKSKMDGTQLDEVDAPTS